MSVIAYNRIKDSLIESAKSVGSNSSNLVPIKLDIKSIAKVTQVSTKLAKSHIRRLMRNDAQFAELEIDGKQHFIYTGAFKKPLEDKPVSLTNNNLAKVKFEKLLERFQADYPHAQIRRVDDYRNVFEDCTGQRTNYSYCAHTDRASARQFYDDCEYLIVEFSDGSTKEYCRDELEISPRPVYTSKDGIEAYSVRPKEEETTS